MRKSPVSSFYRDDEKKKMWVHRVCYWECRRKSRHPKRFFGKNLFTVHELILRITKLGSEHKSTGFRNPYQERHIYICVQIYTHPRISQSDFPVMRFIALQHKSTETKIINISLAGTWPGRQAYHKARQVRRQEKNRKSEKKKKMWVHLVCNWECRRKLRHPRK